MELNKYIEHTILKAGASEAELEQVALDAMKYNFLGVCINPNYVKFIKTMLKGSDVKIVTVVNFPLATNTIETTLFQTQTALKDGADEIDTVINLSELKNKNYNKVIEDIKKTKEICANHNLKVILETDLLTPDEIKTASKCAIEARADFIKTSTGFVKNGVGATIENVKLMYEIASQNGVGVKASGGIKDYLKAKQLIEAGAKRLGTSSGVDIILGEK